MEQDWKPPCAPSRPLTALERKLNRYRNAAVLLLVVLAGVVLVGATGDDEIQDVVKTRSLEVVNPQGVAVAKLMAVDGGGALALSNDRGKFRVIAGSIAGKGGLVQIFGEDDKMTVEIRQSKGGGYIKLFPPNDGTGRATMGFDEGEPFVLLLGKGGSEKNSWLRSGDLSFAVDGQKQIQVGSTNLGGMAFFSNKTGEEVVQIFVDEYGNGAVGAYNRKGKGRTLKPGS